MKFLKQFPGNLCLGLILPSLFVLILMSRGIAQDLTVSFTEQLVLGNNLDASLEYQFASIRAVDTDGDDRIYVAGVNNDIRVFSSEGEFITTFGGQGRGPGEFINFDAMTVADDGRVIIYDPRSFRITIFYHLGDSVATYSNNDWKAQQGLQIPQGNIVPLADGDYAITSKMQDPGYGRPANELDNRVVHIVPPDFSEFKHSFFDIYKEGLFNPNEPLMRKMARDNAYALKELPDGRLALTHEVYDGFLHILDFNSNFDRIQKTEGAFAGFDRYEILHGETMDFVEAGYKNLVSGGGPLGRYIYQKKLNSMGLFANDRWIINILSVADETDISFYMEFFDASDGSYLGYTDIEDDFDTHSSEGTRQFFFPKHLDRQDQLYYVDYSGEIPVLRVTKITIEE